MKFHTSGLGAKQLPLPGYVQLLLLFRFVYYYPFSAYSLNQKLLNIYVLVHDA